MLELMLGYEKLDDSKICLDLTLFTIVLLTGFLNYLIPSGESDFHTNR